VDKLSVHGRRRIDANRTVVNSAHRPARIWLASSQPPFFKYCGNQLLSELSTIVGWVWTRHPDPVIRRPATRPVSHGGFAEARSKLVLENACRGWVLGGQAGPNRRRRSGRQTLHLAAVVGTRFDSIQSIRQGESSAKRRPTRKPDAVNDDGARHDALTVTVQDAIPRLRRRSRHQAGHGHLRTDGFTTPCANPLRNLGEPGLRVYVRNVTTSTDLGSAQSRNRFQQGAELGRGAAPPARLGRRPAGNARGQLL